MTQEQREPYDTMSEQVTSQIEKETRRRKLWHKEK